jgi:deoxyhypusine synthase
MAKASKKDFQMKLTPQQLKERKTLLNISVNQIDMNATKSVVDLVENFKGMSVQARRIGACADVFERMLTDKERPTILLGLAGPLIAGGLRKVIRDMIEHNLVDALVSTGAILYQDLYQARGFKHFKGTPTMDDGKLRDLYIDRIYDTYVDETKFWNTDMWVSKFSDTLEPRNYSSREFLVLLSARIDDENSILHTARKRGIPVFAPAINDSSIGIGITDHYHRCKKNHKPGIHIDSIRDNYELTQIVVKSKRTSAIYIAGGVPKNYINDSIVMSYIFNTDTGGHKYAFQLTTDVPHWGGLSGSTLQEAMSWGKVSTKATTAMGFVEPTVSLPLVAGYVLGKNLGTKRKRIHYTWENDILGNISFK